VAIPVDAPPGEAQVDFGYLGTLYDPGAGRERKAWVFVLVMACSRQMVTRVVFDQTSETWIRLHVEAFEELGGVPTVIVPDNLKAAVVRAAFAVDERAALHRSYRELARHYGCRIDPAPPRSPEKKGRVEAGVGYLRRNSCRPCKAATSATPPRRCSGGPRRPPTSGSTAPPASGPPTPSSGTTGPH